MITFKQFLIEGGKATEKLGTVRATQADVEAALQYVAKYTNIPVDTLKDRLLGSTRLTAAGLQKDSGDIDIAINNSEVDQDKVVDAMTFATGNKPHVTGGNIFSFAVPIKKHKVQVDLMFVPDIAWAKFSHHASEHSKHKSGVRNELLHSALKFSMEPGKDVRLKDESGNDVARASRAYKLDQGVERIFKIAPLRKDGKGGRVKAPVHATPDQVRQTLDMEGNTAKFSPEADTIRDPEKFAKLLFGPKAQAKDMLSTEQLINMIRKHKAKDAEAIFKDAVKGIKRLKFPVPDELQQYDTMSTPEPKGQA